MINSGCLNGPLKEGSPASGVVEMTLHINDVPFYCRVIRFGDIRVTYRIGG